ncbi:hypothetical protein AZE42_11817, partial [Rhizopogon vesiculosus]
FSFSIDDALLIFNDEPRSPALSASSSTEGSNLSEEFPSTPGASDDEDFCELQFLSPRLRPHYIKIRPLYDENVDNIIDEDTKAYNAFVELSEETREEDEGEQISTRATFRTLFPHTSLLPAEQPKPRGLSRFSKALPRLSFSVHPSSTFPAVPSVLVSANDVDPRETRDPTHGHLLTSPATGQAPSFSSHVCSI